MAFTVNIQGQTYSVRWRHQPPVPTEHNGQTVCTMETPDASVEWVSGARCSLKDNFSRPKGRLISLGRVVDKLYPGDHKIHRDVMTQYESWRRAQGGKG
jgi:hypothetical protein